MKKKNVLVFPCGSEIALEINRALGFVKFLKLYGASSVGSNPGKYFFENYIDSIPHVDEPNFIEVLNQVIKEYEIDFIFPAHDSVVLKLAEHADSIDCDIVGSNHETCKIARSKQQTYAYMENKIKVPASYGSVEEISEYPVFLKPDVGQGSKGTYKASTQEEAEFYLRQDPSLLILEYLPGKEYTIDCFTDKNGELKFAGTRERARISNGISVHAVLVKEDEPFKQIAKIINENFSFRGAWFFQLKLDKNNELSLLEVAPRIAGTMGFFRNLGANLPLMSIYDRLGYEISVNLNRYHLEMDRSLVSSFSSDLYYDTVYIDFDDTLIVDDKVNTLLMAFVFQCMNENKKIFLITRHKKDIHVSLKQYKLDNLFDQIIHIQDGNPKSNHITSQHAILIDDSFAERNDVSNKLGIPVFDLDSLESLVYKKR